MSAATKLEADPQCIGCRAHLSGNHVSVTYVNGHGPICNGCIRARRKIVITTVANIVNITAKLS